MSLLLGNNNQRAISGIQTTVMWTLQQLHRMFQNLGISCRVGRALCAYRQPTAEQHTHTKTHASSAHKNTQKVSTVQTVATQKFTENAQQPSQLYSHS